MSRQATVTKRCAHEGCKEFGHYSYDSQKDAREAGRRNPLWYCCRHSHPDEVLICQQDDARSVTAIVVSDGINKYWRGPSFLSSGLTSGPGFMAIATDFPDGTTLTVTSVIRLPLP